MTPAPPRAGSGQPWRPTASRRALVERARILGQIRAFFAGRAVLEVETPTLVSAGVTDPHLASLSLDIEIAGEPRHGYLQTSPEYAMKRLLAADVGPIYQICRAYRAGESGPWHNPEFTMLEWYRPGFDHHRLMDEVDALLQHVVGAAPAERLSYGEACRRHLTLEAQALDVHTATASQLAAKAHELGIDAPGFETVDSPASATVDDWLQLLLHYQVEPHLGRGKPTLLYDYPASQAALAKVRPATDQEPAVAERFEVYLGGVELANGFHELTDAREQRQRFEANNVERQRLGLPTVDIDENLLAALESGMPASAGVALGIDRLVMVALGATHIDQVLAFPIDRA